MIVYMLLHTAKVHQSLKVVTLWQCSWILVFSTHRHRHRSLQSEVFTFNKNPSHCYVAAPLRGGVSAWTKANSNALPEIVSKGLNVVILTYQVNTRTRKDLVLFIGWSIRWYDKINQFGCSVTQAASYWSPWCMIDSTNTRLTKRDHYGIAPGIFNHLCDTLDLSIGPRRWVKYLAFHITQVTLDLCSLNWVCHIYWI